MSIMKSYPFINPIIVSSDNCIIDGQHRLAVCDQNNCEVSYIQLEYNKDELYDANCIEEIIRIRDEQRKNLEKWFNKNKTDFLTQIELSASDDKIGLFYKYRSKFNSAEKFTKTFRETYTQSSNNYKNRYKIRELFSSKFILRDHLMDKNEQELLMNLPNDVIIHRGMSEDEYNKGNYGVSWSLNKSVAEKFAFQYLHNYDTRTQKHLVKTITIKKEDIVAYFNQRGEDEIIYIQK